MGKGKLSITTSNKDYGGNLGLPDKVKQREFETTGQFFRRLDRLIAKAKVEASMESRFDITLGKDARSKDSKKPKGKRVEDEEAADYDKQQKMKRRRRRRR